MTNIVCAPLPCGCRITGNGTLQFPVTVERCPACQAACNEHEALLAVAEAARNLTADNGGRALDDALARLAEVQGGAK